MLVNLGCTLRVLTQVFTDWHPAAFNVIGFSGTLELIGLSWWGLGMLHVLLRRRSGRLEREALPPTHA